MAKAMRVLSIDGGGIRGLIPASILVEVEAMIQAREGDQARLADYFDLLAGTSTGGLIAGLLGVPAQPSGRPAWTARDIQDFYVENAATMFALPLRQRIRSVTGLFGERYASTGFDRALGRALGPRDAPSPAMLSDLLRPTVIPTYNVTTAEPYFFKQHEAAKNGGLDFALHDLARATAAAPTYFESMLVQSGGTPLGACVDGGVFANNPTMCAYAEARGAFGFGARELAVLSLGTGSNPRTYTHRQVKNWGLVGWARPLIDMMLNGSEQIVDHQVRQVFESLGGDATATQYLRMQVDLGRESKATAKMDNVDPVNLRRLVTIGQEAVEAQRVQLERFIDTQLLGPPDDSPAGTGASRGPAS